MKKLLFLFLVFCSFQTISAQNVTFGVKGGANFSSYIANYEPARYKYKLGFQVGGFVKISLVDRLFLQPELLFSLQGTRYDLGLLSLELPQTIPGSDPLFQDDLENIKVNESTIILPIMVKYYFTEWFSAELGPQLDYLFNRSSKFDGSTSSNDNSINQSDSVSEFNFGVNLGFGYDLNKNIGLDLRYNYGFNHLHSVISNSTNNRRNNSVFSLSLEYVFD